MKIILNLISFLQDKINKRNRKRLINQTPTLVCSNCTGGFMYHWLGLKFRSPFINLYMTNEDFVTALENWDEFLATEITEIQNSGRSYPVGESIKGVLIHFVHYNTFAEAVSKWKQRCARIDTNNMAVMLTNYDPKWGG